MLRKWRLAFAVIALIAVLSTTAAIISPHGPTPQTTADTPPAAVDIPTPPTPTPLPKTVASGPSCPPVQQAKPQPRKQRDKKQQKVKTRAYGGERV